MATSLWIAVEPGGEHIGEQYAAQCHIDWSVEGRLCFGHGKPSELLAAA
jgi:hypothetical protein